MTEIKGIEKGTLEFILEISKSSFPNEVVGMLKIEDKVIQDVILAPGTYTSDKSAIMRVDQLPMTLKTAGSFHSHPSGNINPSSKDLEMFSKNGDYHIITGYPFKINSWKCFNREGDERELETLESDNQENRLWEEELKRVKEEMEE